MADTPTIEPQAIPLDEFLQRLEKPKPIPLDEFLQSLEPRSLTFMDAMKASAAGQLAALRAEPEPEVEDPFSVGATLKEGGRGVLRGLFGLQETGGGAIESAGSLIKKMTPLQRVGAFVEDLGKIQGDVAAAVQEQIGRPEMPWYSPAAIAGTAGEAAPGLAQQVGLAAATGGASLAGTLAFMGTAGGQVYGSQYRQALDAYEDRDDLSEDEKKTRSSMEAGGAAIITGLTNLPVARTMLKTIPGADKMIGNSALKIARSMVEKKTLGRLFQAGAAEAWQETSEQVLTDLMASFVREDPEVAKQILTREYLENLGNVAIASAGLGALAKAGIEVQARRPPPPKPGQAQPLEPAPAPTEPPPKGQVTREELEAAGRELKFAEKAAPEKEQAAKAEPGPPPKPRSVHLENVADTIQKQADPEKLQKMIQQPEGLTPAQFKELGIKKVPSKPRRQEISSILKERMAEQAEPPTAEQKVPPAAPAATEAPAPAEGQAEVSGTPVRFKSKRKGIGSGNLIGPAETEGFVKIALPDGGTAEVRESAIIKEGQEDKADRIDQEESEAKESVPDPTDPVEDPVSSDEVAMPASVNTPMSLKPSSTAPIVSVPQVIDSLAKIPLSMGKKVPVRFGRFRQKAFGIYKRQPQVIRIKQANSITTAAHEVGHSIEFDILEDGKKSRWLTPAMNKELVKLGRALYGPNRPHNGYRSEGVAEFMRLFLFDPASGQQKAPQFTKAFTDKFLSKNEALKEALSEARKTAKNYQEQGSLARVKAHIVKDTIRERIRMAASKLRRQLFSTRQWIEALRPLDVVASTAEALMGRKLDPEEHPGFVARALRRNAISTTREFVQRQPMTFNRTPVQGVDPLNSIKGLIKRDQVNDFAAYLLAKRTMALLDDPYGPRETGVSRQDAEQVIKDLESLAFQEAAQKVYDWNDAVLNYAAQASPTFAEIVKKIKERDPGNYIPLAAEFRDDMGALIRGSGKTSSLMSRIGGRLVGTTRPKRDPFQQMIANAQKIISAANDRYIWDQIVKLAKVPGMGHIIEEIPATDSRVAARRTIKDLIRELKKMGVEIDSDPDSDLLEQTVVFFANSVKARPDENIITTWDSETKSLRHYEVIPDLYEAIARVGDIYRLPALAHWTLGLGARTYRAGTTAMRPAFATWNLLRDPWSFFANTQTSANGFQMASAWFDAFIGNGYNVLTGKRKDPWIDAYYRLGVEISQQLAEDIPHLRRVARQTIGHRKVIDVVPLTIDWLRDLIQVSEAAPRQAELRLLAKDIGWEPGTEMTLNQMFRLMLAAKEVTTDFSASGDLVRVGNTMIPFMNAAIQGPRANLRAMRRTPGTFFWRGGQLAVATLLLWWKYKDEDWYKELDIKERVMNWHFPVTIDGKETLLRLPRPFELGLVFAALPEVLFDSWYRRNPEDVKAWFTTFLQTSTPNYIPPVFEEWLEQYGNRDRFFDTPIVPKSMEGRPAAEQYDMYTTKASITIGRIFGISPKRVDHAIVGLFGPLARDIAQTLGLGPNISKEREGEPTDIPIIGRIFQRGGRVIPRSKSIRKMYDNLEKMLQRERSVENPETEDERRLRLMATNAQQAVSAILYLRSQESSFEKRAELGKEAVRMASEINRAVDNKELRPLYFRQQERNWELEESFVKADKQLSEGKDPETIADWAGRVVKQRPKGRSEKDKLDRDYWEREIEFAMDLFKTHKISAREVVDIYRQHLESRKDRLTEEGLSRKTIGTRLRTLRIRLSKEMGWK